MSRTSLIACHDCDLVQHDVDLSGAPTVPQTVRCARCDAVLYRHVPGSLDRTLALTLTGVLLFLVANAFPLVELDAQGRRIATTLFGAAHTLYDQDKLPVALLVLATTMIAPALELAAMVWLLLPLRLGQNAPGFGQVFRAMGAVRPWGMVEVFMLGMLVSLAKLSHLAHVIPGISLWSFAALMVTLSAAAASFNPRDLWAARAGLDAPDAAINSAGAATGLHA